MHFLYGDSTWEALAVLDTLTQIQDSIPPFFVFTNHLQRENFSFETVTSLSDYPELGYSLSQNYPNPFNPSTTMEFALPKKSNVNLSIYNILGEEVRNLVHEELSAGYHKVNFNSTGLPSGIYLYKLTADDFAETKKMILLK